MGCRKGNWGLTTGSNRAAKSTVGNGMGIRKGSVEMGEVMETSYEMPIEEALWSEGFQDDVVTETDTVTVAVENADETFLPEALVE